MHTHTHPLHLSLSLSLSLLLKWFLELMLPSVCWGKRKRIGAQFILKRALHMLKCSQGLYMPIASACANWARRVEFINICVCICLYYVYANVCIGVYMCAWIYVCTYMYVYVYRYTCTYVYVHEYMYVHIYTYMYIDIHFCRLRFACNICMYVYLYIICVYICI